MSPSIEERLAALFLPEDELRISIAESAVDGALWRVADRLVDRDLARRCWADFQPAKADRLNDPAFIGHWRRFLRDGVALGLGLDRFQAAAAQLPADPGPGGRAWLAAFESVASDELNGRLRLRLPRARFDELRTPVGAQAWQETMDSVLETLFYELGLTLVMPELQVDDSLGPAECRCEWNDLQLPAVPWCRPGQVLVNDTPDRLRLLNIFGEPGRLPVTGAEASLVDAGHDETLKKAGLTTWKPTEMLGQIVAAAARASGGALVQRSMVELHALRLRDAFPELIDALWRRHTLDFVVQVLRSLVAEEISIRNLPLVLQKLLELRAVVAADNVSCIIFTSACGGVFAESPARALQVLTPQDHAEFVRSGLRRAISHQYTRGQSTLIVYLLDPKAERRLSEGEDVDPSVASAVVAAAQHEVGVLPPSAALPVLLTTSTVRHRLRNVIAAALPRLQVLAYQELAPEMNIQPIARITVEWAD